MPPGDVTGEAKLFGVPGVVGLRTDAAAPPGVVGVCGVCGVCGLVTAPGEATALGEVMPPDGEVIDLRGVV